MNAFQPKKYIRRLNNILMAPKVGGGSPTIFKSCPRFPNDDAACTISELPFPISRRSRLFIS